MVSRRHTNNADPEYDMALKTSDLSIKTRPAFHVHTTSGNLPFEIQTFLFNVFCVSQV